ncbi:MAG: hypothetical protein JW776_12805 [Candidatus Lokiarchaeota archaeon]|nr:hypothetical protein [Candidatus Lokiarchaeota archaeon]
MVEIVCPNCAANLDVPITPIHTCEFCGTAIQVSLMVGPDGTSITGEELPEETKKNFIFNDHYIVRSNYTASEAQSIMEDWVKKIPGAPQDFENTATITKRVLKFYPIWVGEYNASSDYRGIDNWPNFHRPAFDRPGWFEAVSYYQREESGNVLREYQIPLLGLKSTPNYLKNYVVPTTGKEYFDITHVKELGGEIIDSNYSSEEAKRTMRLAVMNRQMSEMRKEVHTITDRDDRVEERDVFYIQFPVYEIDFTYNKKKYQAFIDGSTGRIIHIDVPISRKFKLISLIGGLGQIGVGIGLFVMGILIPSIMILGIAVGIGLVTYGSILLSMNFRKGAQEKQI